MIAAMLAAIVLLIVIACIGLGVLLQILDHLEQQDELELASEFADVDLTDTQAIRDYLRRPVTGPFGDRFSPERHDAAIDVAVLIDQEQAARGQTGGEQASASGPTPTDSSAA